MSEKTANGLHIYEITTTLYLGGDFPEEMKKPKSHIEAYFQGDWGLTFFPSVSVIGSRNPSREGIERTKVLVKQLTDYGYIIVSGLESGIDTAAHKTAINCGCKTIAVIGTDLNHYYPIENKTLQDEIAKRFLLISQVPVKGKIRVDTASRKPFLDRNRYMAKISDATIIVETGELSETRAQARECFELDRNLFILENNFLNPLLTWPKEYEKLGAIRVKSFSDILKNLPFETKL